MFLMKLQDMFQPKTVYCWQNVTIFLSHICADNSRIFWRNLPKCFSVLCVGNTVVVSANMLSDMLTLYSVLGGFLVTIIPSSFSVSLIWYHLKQRLLNCKMFCCHYYTVWQPVHIFKSDCLHSGAIKRVTVRLQKANSHTSDQTSGYFIIMIVVSWR